MHRSTIATLAIITLTLAACSGPTDTSVVPSAPQAVTVTPGPGAVDVSWQHDGRNVTGFAVHRRLVEGEGTATLNAFERLTEVTAGVRAFRDETVVLGAGYEYTVTADGAAGSSSPTAQTSSPVSAACATTDDVVSVLDPQLAAGIATQLGLASQTISCADLEALTELVVEDAGVTYLAGLQYAANLTRLRLNDNAITALWPLAGLTAIDHLQVAGNDVADLTPIAGLTAMRVLMLSDNPIASIDVVGAFDALQYVGAARTPITDIGMLAGKSDVIYVWLNGAEGITDFSPLATLTGLQVLMVGGTSFDDGDMAMLSAMPDLTRVQVWDTSVSDLSPLAGLDLRVELDIGATAVTDLSPIHDMTSLQQIRLYWLGLTEADIAFLADFDQLTLLNLHGNELTSLAPLVAHGSLGNGVAVDVTLNRLDLESAQVQDDIATLESRGVLLTYEPQRSD